MNFTIFSKSDCPYCHKVKTVMELTGSDHVVYTLGADFSEEEFLGKFGNSATFPQVLCDDKKLGGAVDTIKFLKENRVFK